MVVGLLLIILPGPGTVILLGGLSLLATEFYWAKRWLKKVEKLVETVKNKADNFKSKFN